MPVFLYGARIDVARDLDSTWLNFGLYLPTSGGFVLLAWLVYHPSRLVQLKLALFFLLPGSSLTTNFLLKGTKKPPDVLFIGIAL